MAPPTDTEPAPAAPAVHVTPSLDEVRELARDCNLIPLRHTFVEDCENADLGIPEAARGGARVPAGVGRAGPRRALVVHRLQTPQRAALVARRPGRPVRAGGCGGRAPPSGAAAGTAAVLRRRGRLLRLRPRAHGRAVGGAEPRPGRHPRPRADADRRAGRVRPPHARADDPRERLRGRRPGARGRLPRRRRGDRGRAPPPRRPAAAAARAAGGWGRVRRARVEEQHAARAVRGDGRADRRVHPRRRRLPGRPQPALVGADAGRGVLDLPRPARREPEPVHVLPRLRRLRDRRSEPGAARHGPRRPHRERARSPARARAAPAPRRTDGSPRSCSPTRRSAQST